MRTVAVVFLVAVISAVLFFVQKSSDSAVVGEASKIPFSQFNKQFNKMNKPAFEKRNLFPVCEIGKEVIDCTIKFTDKNLEKDIKKILKLPSSVPIRLSTLKQTLLKEALSKNAWPSLELEGDYTNLRGLEFFSPLVSLTLNDPSTPDITPLRYLPNLEFLDIFGDLSNLDAFSVADDNMAPVFLKLFTLKIHYYDVNSGIGVDSAGIVDIKPLSTLQKLTYLSLPFHDIEDITPFATGFYSLEGLDLRSNHINDVSPLLSLPLLVSLDLTGNPLPKSCPKPAVINAQSSDTVKNFLNKCLGKG